MKAKLLLSATAIGLFAMSPAFAETVIVPIIPGSLDGADSAAATVGPAGQRTPPRTAPRTPRTQPLRPEATAETAATTVAPAAPRARPRRQRRPTPRETARACRPPQAVSGALARKAPTPTASPATVARRPRPPSRPRPAPPARSRRSRPPQGAPAGLQLFGELFRAGEMAATRPLQLRRSAAAVRSTCRPARSAAMAVRRRRGRRGLLVEWRSRSGGFRPILRRPSRCFRVGDGRKR